MSVIPRSPDREARKELHQEIAKQAFEKLLELSDFQQEGHKEVFDFVMCHPRGRRQFLHYCAKHQTWRVDRIDEWEYYHMLALSELAVRGELF